MHLKNVSQHLVGVGDDDLVVQTATQEKQQFSKMRQTSTDVEPSIKATVILCHVRKFAFKARQRAVCWLTTVVVIVFCEQSFGVRCAQFMFYS